MPAARISSLLFGDVMPLSAVISAGASLIGGILGKKSEDKQQKRQIAFAREEREYNKPTNIRARAEEAGFNPLLFIGPGVGNAASGGISGGSANYMGQAIADAGMLIAEGMRNKSAETKRINDLEAQNKELQKKLVQQTIRPPMGGIYQSGGPSIRKPPEPKALADMAWNDPEMIGPKPLVPMIDAVSGRWFGLDPGAASRIDGIGPGSTWIGEDSEAILGEVMGNVNSTGAAVSGLVDRGPYEGPMYFLPQMGDPQRSQSVAPNLPEGERVDWSATSGPNAPVKPKGMSDKAWERLVKKNRAIQGMAR